MSDTNVRGQLAETWKSRLQRFYDGNMTVADFCATEGVSIPSFYQWQRRLKLLDPNFGRPDQQPRRRRRTNCDRTSSGPMRSSAASSTAVTPAAPRSGASTRATRTSPTSAFQPVQLTTTADVVPLASIHLPSGVVVELQRDPTMICQVLERFLPLALHAGSPSC